MHRAGLHADSFAQIRKRLMLLIAIGTNMRREPPAEQVLDFQTALSGDDCARHLIIPRRMEYNTSATRIFAKSGDDRE